MKILFYKKFYLSVASWRYCKATHFFGPCTILDVWCLSEIFGDWKYNENLNIYTRKQVFDELEENRLQKGFEPYTEEELKNIKNQVSYYSII